MTHAVLDTAPKLVVLGFAVRRLVIQAGRLLSSPRLLPHALIGEPARGEAA